MRILFISEYFYPRVAGGEKWSWDLCRGLAKAGHEVVVITGTEEEYKYHTFYKIENIDKVIIHRVALVGKTFKDRIAFMKTMYSFLNENYCNKKFDIVHIMGYIPLLPALMSKVDGKYIWSVHSYLGKHWKTISGTAGIINWMFEDMLLMVGKRKCIIQVPSEYIKDKIGFKDVKVFPNYIDVKNINNVTKGITKKYIVDKYNVGKHQTVLCAVGSLQKVKGFDKLIEAMSHTHNDYLIIVGEGEERENLLNLINLKNLKNRVFMIGKKSHNEVLKIMKASDYFVSSSVCESFSYVMAEAFALGKPILTTPTGIAEELNEEKYIQVQIHNDIRELVCNYKGLAKECENKNDIMDREKYANKFIEEVYGR